MTTATLCRECGRDPVVVRGICWACMSTADQQSRDDRFRDLYAAEPWEFDDQDDEEMEP